MNYKLTIAFAITVASLSAAETKVQIKDLPEAVQNTIKEQTKSGKLRNVSKEVEKGKTYYEAETVINGKSRDVLIDPEGHVVEVEEATSLGEIPAAARTALQREAGSGKILSVESVTKDSTVNYEAVIQKNGKKSEIAVGADGSPVKD
jgi:hypothetical protein